MGSTLRGYSVIAYRSEAERRGTRERYVTIRDNYQTAAGAIRKAFELATWPADRVQRLFVRSFRYMTSS